VYRWTFHNIDKRGGGTFLYNNGPVTSVTDENLLFRQTYTLQASFNGGPFVTRVSNAPVAPSRVGPASMPDYAKLRDQAVTTLPGGWKIFAGQADDPFFLDLRVFDLLYGGNLKEVGQDTLGIWSTAGRPAQRPGRDLPDRHHHQGRRPDQGRPQLPAQQRRRQPGCVPAVGDAAAEPVGEANREAKPARRTRR
jgi:hypothetical protein